MLPPKHHQSPTPLQIGKILYLSLPYLAIALFLLGVYSLKKNYSQKKYWQHSQQTLENLFADTYGTRISQQDRHALNKDKYGLNYGEITWSGFSKMLAIVQPKSGEIFYDLGSGSGKAVLCAALRYDWKKCCGIELLPGLHQLSLLQLEKFQRCFPNKHCVRFIQDDFLQQNISDAHIIFINATAFLDKFWGEIVEKLQCVQAGTRIIIASKQLDKSQYQLLDAQMLPMSWGLSSVYIYQKT